MGKLPAFVTVGPVTYRVRRFPLDGNDMGLISYKQQCIDIDATMTPLAQRLTLCHEIAHIMLLPIQSDSEAAAESLSQSLYQLVRDNPDFIKYISEGNYTPYSTAQRSSNP